MNVDAKKGKAMKRNLRKTIKKKRKRIWLK